MDNDILSVKVKATLEYNISSSEIQDEADRLFGPGTDVDYELMYKIAERLVKKRINNMLDTNGLEAEDFSYIKENEYKDKIVDGNSR